MTEKRFQIIHLGNPYDFVVKDHQTNNTYGKLQGDDKSLMELLNDLSEENEQLKQSLLEVEHELTSLNGLSAFDKCASQLGYVEVFDEDYWELDYSEMLKKIDKKLKGDVE